jgi:hypothetical protein
VGGSAGGRLGVHGGRRRLQGGKARAIACDAMIIPVVTGDLDAGAVDELIVLCVQYHRIRAQVPSVGTPGGAGPDGGADAIGGGQVVPAGLTGSAAQQDELTALVSQTLAELEQQILAQIQQVVSGPGGVASFLRRQLLGKGLNGPSLPLDAGQTDDIPVHLRSLVALRDQTCQYPGGYFP